MKIEYRIGDVCNAAETLIAHGCNAQGVMGAGVAAQIKWRYPEAYSEYRATYINEGFQLGEVIFTPSCNDKIIASCITQQYFGRTQGKVYVDYQALKRCMQHIDDFCDNNQIEAFAMPMIGAGLAGGNWDIISQLIESNVVSTQPVVYTPKPV